MKRPPPRRASEPYAPRTDAEKSQAFEDAGRIAGTVQARLEFLAALTAALKHVDPSATAQNGQGGGGAVRRPAPAGCPAGAGTRPHETVM